MKKGGFTLVELMVTVVLLALLLALSAPSFYEMIQNNRLVTQTNELVSALNMARSEAVKRNTAVLVLRSGDNWSNGWYVGVDESDPPDGDIADVGDEELKAFGALEGATNLSCSANSIRFSAAGSADTGLCCEVTYPSTGAWRRIQVSLTGGVAVDQNAHCGG